MVRKIGILVFVLVLAGGGFFYRQNNQKDVKELNKNLPPGVKIVKSIFGFGKEYKVINKIDGYEFKVPSAWKGVNKIEYTPEREMAGYFFNSVELEGIRGEGRIVGINRFKLNTPDINLIDWVKNTFELFGLSNNFNKDKISNLEIVSTSERIDLLTGYGYFFKKNSVIYSITGGSEDFIREIISNGKW